MSSETRPLDGLLPGEAARVVQFLFGALRSICGDIGIREGQLVRCRAGTAGALVLDIEDGRTISLARDWARYIRVEAATPAAAA